MAPFASPSPQWVIEKLRAEGTLPSLPLRLGLAAGPTVAIEKNGEGWTLRALVMNAEAMAADAQWQDMIRSGAIVEGYDSRFLVPGATIASAPDAATFADVLAKQNWPALLMGKAS